MYYCIHDYSQEKERFFCIFSADFISEFYIYMYMYTVHVLYTFICSHHAKKAHQRLKVYVRVTCSW